MKIFRNILTEGCVFTTVITLLFSLVAFIVNRAEGMFKEVSIPVSRFFVILAFSFLIAVANRILSVRRLHVALRLLIHYAALLVSFIFVFVAAGNLKITGTASVFVAIVVFTVLYALMMAVVFSFLRAVGHFDKSYGCAHKARNTEQYKRRF